MKSLLFVFAILFGSISFAAVPTGFWFAENIVPDDGAYGAYYKSWLVFSETHLDQIITLGAHYDKKKFVITGSDQKSADIFDPEDQSTRKLSYQVNGDTLVACFGQGGCQTFVRSLVGPVFGVPPQIYPRIQVVSTWCVEQDCESLTYSEHQSESLFNLYEGFKPAVFRKYPGPVLLASRYGLQLSLMAFSYRFENDGSKLSSFATSLFFMAEDQTQGAILKKSGVLRLKDGVLTSLEGIFNSKKVSVEFAIKVL
ncbi:hypothetical protein [Bdellovibrio sp. HCB337]|uniref:hypothetical protein n=1 Tax=Bdellovibrio sp. HCB337 TaxID=3394358 RepID=UPI0039A43F96